MKKNNKKLSHQKQTHRVLFKLVGSLAGLYLLTMTANSYADAYDSAKQLVKEQACGSEETVDQILTRKHRTLYNDLGWRVVEIEEGEFLVERSFLASKVAELRYRWRVDATGSPKAESERARKLCDL